MTRTVVGLKQHVVEVDDLHVSYGGKQALAGVNLRLQRGHITALVGPSGCGKSTFLSCLNRLTDLVPGCEVAGRLRVDGRDLRAPDCDVQALRRSVGMVSQQPDPFPFSIRRNFHLPLREAGLGRAACERAMQQALAEVGLWEEVRARLASNAHSLSGGQQQRLCIARALALQPRVILFDEPCSALDPLSSAVVEQHIASLRGRVSVVIATHNLAQARRIADELVVFWLRDGAGRVIASGPSEDLFVAASDPDALAYLQGSRG